MNTIKSIMSKKKVPAKIKTGPETGFVLWEGPSPVDGKPIAMIATMKTSNTKTGQMIQTWIIRTDIPPHELVKSGQDQSICGDCPFSSGRGCYVTVFQAPLAVYNAYKKGNYKKLKPSEIALIAINRVVRLGAYGDPGMVPFNILEALVSKSIGHTGYTHAYNQPFFDPRILKLCMLSANTVEDSIKYNGLGIRTFTAITENDPIPNTAIVCPNTTHNIQCIDCKLCTGGINGKSIVVQIHGSKVVVNKFTQNRII